MDLRQQLDARYDASLEAALSSSDAQPVPAGLPRPRLPPALRESIVLAATLRDPAPLADFYCERMPRMLVEQVFCGDDPARRLLWMELDAERTPRFSAALRGVAEVLEGAGLDEATASVPRPGACVARLAAATLLGSGLPLLGAYPAEREVIARDLAAGTDPHAVVDLRLSGNLVHEICHGPRRDSAEPPPPWMLLESAAIHLGVAAFPRHVFPEVAAEAVPGVAPFVLVGEALALLFGRAALWRLAWGESAERTLGAVAARVLTVAGWQEWMRRGEPPFARDASDGLAWVKLADATRGPSPLSREIARAVAMEPMRAVREMPDLLRLADAIAWPELPWWREAPGPADLAMARSAVRAMFHVDLLDGSFQTHPLLPARLHLDVEACLVTRDRDARGVGPGEPPFWIVPPPLCRRLRESGCSRMTVAGTDAHKMLAQMLEDSAWTSSPA